MIRLSGIPVSKGLVIGRVYVLEQDRSPPGHQKENRSPKRPRTPRTLRARPKSRHSRPRRTPRRIHRRDGRRSRQNLPLPHRRPQRPHHPQPHPLDDPDRAPHPEYATSATLKKLADRFAKHPDSTFQSKVDDLRDLASRLLSKLQGKSTATLAQVAENTIIVARDLTPTQTAGFHRKNIIGFVTDLGGRTSHTAIVAGALSLPAVVGAKNLTARAHDGQTIIVDGSKGTIILDPDDETIEIYKERITVAEQARISLHELADLPAITTDGVRIELLGNIEFAEEIDHLLDEGGQGVGLYRTEFLYLTGNAPPTEEDHFNAYAQCIKMLDGKTLTIRTIDLGADKYTQRQEETPERNPFLGLRSIRYSLANQKMFRTQLRAILRASAHGPVKIMFPLITNISEYRSARYFLNEEMEELAEEGIKYNPNIEVGMMVEVPAAALMASAFAREVDFFSVGTNDLVQYTLAVDRTNERVASLYTPIHPAVLRLVRDVARAGRKREIPVSCCGQSAADPAFAALLIGLGVRTLSVTASSLPLVKRTIRALDSRRCERIVKRAIGFDSEAEASSYVLNRLKKTVPEVFDGRTVG